MEKVLIIGNGFDRQLGLKTDYFSFLDWLQLKGFGIDQKFSEISQSMSLGEVNNGIFNTFPRVAETNQEYYARNITRIGKKSLRFDSFSNSQYLPDNFQYKEIYFCLPFIIGQTSFISTKPNVWYCFFQLVRHAKTLEQLKLELSRYLIPYTKLMSIQGNWIDLEGIIKEAISEIINGEIISTEKRKGESFTLINFCLALLLPSSIINENNGWNIAPRHDFIKLNIEKIKEYLIDDFLEIKLNLTLYLKEIHSKNKITWSQFFSSLNNETRLELNRESFGQIISFNYTDFIDPYKKVYHVHGDVRDGQNIIFGLDPFKKDETFHDSGHLSILEENIFNDNSLSKFTKISQLLTLQKSKRENLLINNIEKIVIVGHSIGVQDYSYYFSLIADNEKNIRIDCLWYEFNINDEIHEKEIERNTNNMPRKNNEQSMQNSLFEMLQQYERYAKKRILHRMIFEGRIKFIKTEIQTIDYIKQHYSEYPIF